MVQQVLDAGNSRITEWQSVKVQNTMSGTSSHQSSMQMVQMTCKV